MPPSSSCPDRSGSTPRARAGASASCLLFTILAANHAAARDAPSLPYLPQTAPAALRFAAPAPSAPPPPPVNASAPPTAEDAPASAPAPTAVATVSPTPAAPPEAAQTPEASAQPEAPQNLPPVSGLPILPDEYARPAPVTVEDILPYLVPAPPPASRATYEIK